MPSEILTQEMISQRVGRLQGLIDASRESSTYNPSTYDKYSEEEDSPSAMMLDSFLEALIITHEDTDNINNLPDTISLIQYFDLRFDQETIELFLGEVLANMSLCQKKYGFEQPRPSEYATKLLRNLNIDPKSKTIILMRCIEIIRETNMTQGDHLLRVNIELLKACGIPTE